MKKLLWIIGLFCVLGPSAALGAGELGLDVASGRWPLDPEHTLGITKHNFFGNNSPSQDVLVYEFPMFFPNIYMMSTSIELSEAGDDKIWIDSEDGLFAADIDVDSLLKVNEIDLALYYGIPYVRTITADMLNIDLGMNVRALDVEGTVENELVGKASKSFVVPIPMFFGALQFHPSESLALEAEGRGVSLGPNKVFSVIGRIRWNVMDHVYAAGGYRYDKFDINYQGILIDADISGPFFEAGLSF